MLLSEEYLEVLRQTHSKDPIWGTISNYHTKMVSNLAIAIWASDILDYGCGAGGLEKYLPEFNVWGYDPGIAGKEDSPEPMELVVCTDVLEHVEEKYLDAVLADIRRVTVGIAMLAISCRLAKKVLLDGRNAHLIVKSQQWWLERLRKYFRIVTRKYNMKNKALEVIVI